MPQFSFRILSSILLFVALSNSASAQIMNHYWSTNFNSQSTLLSGAVVAGDGGNTSIYYNPATISEIMDGSNLSFSATLFTWGVYYFKNALGNNNNIYNVSFNVQPQFLSYSKKVPNSKLAFAITAITRMKEKFDISYYDSRQLDIIPTLSGKEIYVSHYKYFLDFHDTWIGLAASYDINKRFKIGASIFITSTYLSYRTTTSTFAYSTTDTVYIDGKPNPAPVSSAEYNEDIKFNNYRLVFKLGASYVLEKWRFGLNITSGSLSVFSGGNEANRYQSISNITDNSTGTPLPNFIIVNGRTKSEINTQMKYPMSVSFGFIKEINNKNNRLYFTAEYFSGIKPYKLVSAPVTDEITSSIIYDQMENKDWLSVADVAKPVFNVAVGYRWEIHDNLMFLSGFRTDFNNINGADYGDLNEYNKINTTDFDIYHYTGGFQFYFLQKYLLVAGGELSFGYSKNKRQIANFTDPVEYSPDNQYVLQGPLSNTMDVYYLGFNVYLSINFNFGNNKKK